MVATAIYSVTMVLWKETGFPLCRAMERRWKRNVVSRVSSVIVVIRLPIFCVSSMAISCHVPAFKMPFKHKFVLPDVCTVSQWSTGAKDGRTKELPYHKWKNFENPLLFDEVMT